MLEGILDEGITQISEYFDEIYPDIESLSKEEIEESKYIKQFIEEHLYKIKYKEEDISKNPRKSRGRDKSPKVKSVESILVSHYREMLGIENDMESKESSEMMSYIKANLFKVHRLFSERKDDIIYKALGPEKLLEDIMSGSSEKIVTTTEVGKGTKGVPTPLKVNAEKIGNTKDEKGKGVRDD